MNKHEQWLIRLQLHCKGGWFGNCQPLRVCARVCAHSWGMDGGRSLQYANIRGDQNMFTKCSLRGYLISVILYAIQIYSTDNVIPCERGREKKKKKRKKKTHSSDLIWSNFAVSLFSPFLFRQYHKWSSTVSHTHTHKSRLLHSIANPEKQM